MLVKTDEFFHLKRTHRGGSDFSAFILVLWLS